MLGVNCWNGAGITVEPVERNTDSVVCHLANERQLFRFD